MIYENVKELCRRKHITVIKIEEDLGLPQGSIIKWKNHNPGIWRVKAVADYLDVTLDTLAGGKL